MQSGYDDWRCDSYNDLPKPTVELIELLPKIICKKPSRSDQNVVRNVTLRETARENNPVLWQGHIRRVMKRYSTMRKSFAVLTLKAFLIYQEQDPIRYNKPEIVVPIKEILGVSKHYV